MNKIVKRILKIVLVIVAALIIIAVVGFRYLYNNGLSGQTADTEVKEGQIKVACIGDSITYGHGISDWEKNNYPAVLGQILGEEYHVANFGSSGTCVNPDGDQPYTGRATYQDSLDYNADIIATLLQEKYAETNVEIIDVHSLTKQHPEWFEKDGIHPNNDGAGAIAELVAKEIKG